MIAKKLSVIATLLCGLTARVGAQQEEPIHPDWRVLAGIHYGRATRWSVALGVARILSRSDRVANGYIQDSYEDRQVLFLLEPGTRGDRVSVGYGLYSVEDDGVGEGSLRLSLLRTRRGGQHRRYVALEGAACGFPGFCGFRLGEALAVDHKPAKPRHLFLADFHLGW